MVLSVRYAYRFNLLFGLLEQRIAPRRRTIP
jgi:hypothetical protein